MKFGCFASERVSDVENYFELNVDICLKGIGFQLNAQEKNHILEPHIHSIQLILIKQFLLAVVMKQSIWMIFMFFI